jgi:hypothetical protein
MNIIEKLKVIYPSLTDEDFEPSVNGTIKIENASDGKSDYIKVWNHPTLPRPTAEELA